MSAPALVEEAMRKAGIVWITVPGDGPARPAWPHWHEGACYVITGGVEQPLPELAAATTAHVTAPSKDAGGRLVTWVAAVSVVPPASDGWQAVVPAMHAKRLNPPDGDRQPERWAAECTLLRLAPTGEVTQAPGSMPQDSGAAPPLPSPAVTSGPLPYVLGRRSSK